MAHVRIKQLLDGSTAVGSEVVVRGWVRSRRDSKAGLSFVQVHDGSCFAPIQVVAPGAVDRWWRGADMGPRERELQASPSSCAR